MKILRTKLHEIETSEELKKLILENENVMVSCGRMGPMCLPVYNAMEELAKERDNISFRVMAFDNPDAFVIRNLPECRGFMGLPFTLYYKKGKVVHATSGIQNRNQIAGILNTHFTG